MGKNYFWGPYFIEIGLEPNYGAVIVHDIDFIVYVEWESRVNFVTIFVDQYQNKLWGICHNLNQFTHLSSASGPNDDVIKMAA